MDPATRDQALGAIRVVVPVIFTIIASLGWLTDDNASVLTRYTAEALIAVVTLIFAIWSIARNSQAGQIAKVAKLPVVKQVVVSDKKLMGVNKLKNQAKVIAR